MLCCSATAPSLPMPTLFSANTNTNICSHRKVVAAPEEECECDRMKRVGEKSICVGFRWKNSYFIDGIRGGGGTPSTSSLSNCSPCDNSGAGYIFPFATMGDGTDSAKRVMIPFIAIIG